jgi:hypothetical protein
MSGKGALLTRNFDNVSLDVDSLEPMIWSEIILKRTIHHWGRGNKSILSNITRYFFLLFTVTIMILAKKYNYLLLMSRIKI